MRDLTFLDRQRLAAKLKRLDHTLIEEVTSRFFQQAAARNAYRENSRSVCAADAGYHLKFLRTAIEFGSRDTFAQYIHWTARLLQARNIPPHHLGEFLTMLFDSLEPHLSPAEQTFLQHYVVDIPEDDHREQALPPEQERTPLQISQEVFMQALLAGDRHAAKKIAMEALSNGSPLPDIYMEIFQESLYQIGRLWESNRITVAQEHVATAITQYVIAHMYPNIPSHLGHQGKGLVTGVEGELHQVGANMVADMLEMQGWDIRFLGVNIPQKDIVHMVEDFQPDLIGISTTMVLNVPRVKDLIAEIKDRTQSQPPPRILVGGSAFQSMPDIYREIGADGYASNLGGLLALL